MPSNQKIINLTQSNRATENAKSLQKKWETLPAVGLKIVLHQNSFQGCSVALLLRVSNAFS